MAIVSVYLVINIIFVALLFKRQKVLSCINFVELFLLLLVWLFTVKFSAGFMLSLVGAEVYHALNDVFTATLGDVYLAPSTLILLQAALIFMLCYLTFHTVQYIAEKLGEKRQAERIYDDYRNKHIVSSFDKTTSNKIFILHCRLNE